jgi:hypothetical protein
MNRITHSIRPLALAIALAVSGCQSTVNTPQNPQVVDMAKAGKAYFDEKCKTVAGEKIYRTVPEVEGVLLMKVRPDRSQTQLEDPMWPGAAFAREYIGDSYIKTFLGYENAAGNADGSPGVLTKDERGSIAPDKRLGGRPGYRYVDVMDAKDGQRVRIKGMWNVTDKKDVTAYNVKIELDKNPNYDLNVYSYVLDKTPTTAPAPRYGVTYEDHVIPSERAMGVASTTVKVIDLQTNEVLGEMIRYAYRPRGLRLTEWLTSYRCPDHAYGPESATRKFVDQVLIPKGE